MLKATLEALRFVQSRNLNGWISWFSSPTVMQLTSTHANYIPGRISNIQELQMVTHPEPNVHVYACDGTSDDLDVPIKAVSTGLDVLANFI